MKRLIRNIVRWYCHVSPIRLGKFSLVKTLDLIGFNNEEHINGIYDNDIKINLNLKDWIQKQIFYFGRYEVERKETQYIKSIVKEGDVFFDIGTNVGYYTLMVAKRIGNNGKVFSFEPVTSTFDKLKANVEKNNFKNVSLNKIGISDISQEIEINISDADNSGMSSLIHIPNSSKKEVIKTISLDEYLKEKELEKINLIKIDVEGVEFQAIKGMTETLIKYSPIVLVEILSSKLGQIGKTNTEIYNLFYKNDYKAYEYKYNTLTEISIPKDGSLIIFKK